MKITYLIIFLLLFNNSYAQFGPQQIITTNAIYTECVYSKDLDGDGDMDVLSTGNNSVLWYENLDGQGNFSPQQIVTTYTGGGAANSLYSDDIDGDGDMDVISASYLGDVIVWNENIDGQGDFGTQKIITENANGPVRVLAIDLDVDGDLDVLSALHFDKKIIWNENLDGQGNFGNQQIIISTESNVNSVYTSDIDNDGDIDIISCSDYRVAWYENIDGQGNFGSQQIIESDIGNGRDVHAADIDGDGFIDVLSASFLDGIAWYKNIDGQGSFGVPQLIAAWGEVYDIRTIHVADLDVDGDMDVLAAPFGINKIVWYENTDGQGNFSSQQIISTNTIGPVTVYTEDIDGDGVMDVLSASFEDYKVAWYENFNILSVNELKEIDFVVYPNPTNVILNISNQNDILINSIKVYDLFGRLVLEETDNFNQLNISKLNSGVLVVKIQTTEGIVIKKIIKE